MEAKGEGGGRVWPAARRYASVASLHGVADLGAARSWPERLFWLCLTAFAVFEISQSAYEFLVEFGDPDQRWTYSSSYRMAADGQTLPDVVLCSDVHWNDSAVAELGPAAEFLMGVVGIVDAFGKPDAEAAALDAVEQHRDAFDKAAEEDPRWLDTMWALERIAMVHCEEIMVSCVMGFFQEVDCCAHARVTLTYSPQLRLCLNFSLHTPQTEPGATWGLQLILDPGLRFLNSTTSSLSQGFKLILSKGKTGLLSVYEDTLVAAGSRVRVALSTTESRYRPPRGFHSGLWRPDPPCLTPAQSVGRLNIVTGEYSRVSFFYEVFAAAAEEMCGGCAIPLAVQPGHRVCSPPELARCLPAVLRGAPKTGRDCPEPCERTVVRARLSVAPTTLFVERLALGEPSAAALRHLHHKARNRTAGLHPDQMASLALVTLYYPTKQYQVVELGLRMTLDSLISTVGGVCGVWAGMSVLSLCQLLSHLGKASASALLHKARLNRPGTKTRHGLSTSL